MKAQLTTFTDGIEFTSTLRDPSKPARRQLIFAYKDVQRAVRDNRWKLIRNPLVDRTQLFDLQADPYEMNNLSGQPGQAARIVELTAQLEKEIQHDGNTAHLTVPDPKHANWTTPAANPKRANQTRTIHNP